MGNTSGCGSHYLSRQCYTSRCISGRKVSGRSTKRTSSIGRAPIRGSNTHRGELHWECFCKQSSPAATFFGDTMFCLSGAINVLLFLIIRPGLLLFPRPEELAGPEIELACQGTGSGSRIFSDMAKFRHSPEPTSAALDEGSRSSATQPRVSSRRISDDI